LAVIFQRGLTRDPLILVLLFLATAIGLDTVFEAIRLTEAAFLGNQLIDRSIATLYPLGVHFPRLENLAKFPWQDIFFWVPLAAGSLILTHLALRRRIAVSSGFLLVLLAVSASGTKYPSRLRDQVSARLETYDEDVLGRKVRMIEKRARFNETTGVTREDGYYVARDSQLSAGIVGYSGLPNIVASIYGIALPAVGSPSTDGMPTGYYVVGERTSVRAYGNHEIRWAIPVTGDGQVGFQRFVRTAGKHPTYQFMTFSGEGSMSFGDTKIMINPLRIREENTLLSRGDLNLPNEGERDFNLSIEAPDLDPGFYRFSVTVEDVDPTVWFVRRADPIMFVVYAADTAAGKRKFRKWVPMLGKAMEAIPPKGLERPLVEAYLAPHWAMIPILGDDKMQFEFENDRKQTIYVGGIYSGEYNLRLRSISLEQRTFQTWEAGELKPLHLPSKPFGLP